MPVRRRTSAMIGAIRGSATPRAWWAARAGLVRGPRKLNTVGTPSSRRVPVAWRIAGWNTGAKQKPMPTSATVAATPSGGRVIATPRASRRSALPQRPDMARLPCLATRWPAPTATTAARVDTLKVPARSPPVPQVSSSGPGTSRGAAAASMALTRPVISVAVSPLMRRPVAKAAIWAGVASPASTEPMAAPASSSLRSSRRRSGPSTAGHANTSDTANSRVTSMLSAPSLIDSRNTGRPGLQDGGRGGARPVAGKHRPGEGGVVAGGGGLGAIAQRGPGLGLVQGQLDGGGGGRRGQVLAGSGQVEGIAEAAVGQRPRGQRLDRPGGQLGVAGLAGQAEGGVAVGLGRLPVAGVEIQPGEQHRQPARGDQQPPAMGRRQPALEQS